VFVIGHLGEQIKEKFGDLYTTREGKTIPVNYATQTELLGTAHALHQAKEYLIDSPFIVLMGDDLYARDDIQHMINHHKVTQEWSVLLENSSKPMSAGKCIVNKDGNLIDIVEDPEAKIPINKMYTGGCLLTPEFFEIEMVQLPNSNEYGLPQTFVSKAHERRIKAFDTTYWKRITAPEDLE